MRWFLPSQRPKFPGWSNGPTKPRTPLIARGSGTGLAGGTVPVPGAVVMCLTQFDRVLELDRQNLTMLVEPGVVTQTIYELADAAGLIYPPDPGSMKILHHRRATSPAIPAASAD